MRSRVMRLCSLAIPIVLTCIPLTTMGFMAGPALVSMLSVSVQSDMQGTLQGLISSINGVAAEDFRLQAGSPGHRQQTR